MRNCIYQYCWLRNRIPHESRLDWVRCRPDPLYEAIFTCTGNPVRSIGTQAQPVSQEEEAQTFTAMNSFWFILAALLGQGVDILPK